MATASSSSAKDPSPSPPPAAAVTDAADPTAAASASRSTSPLPLPAPPPPPPSSSSRRLPPPCWTHEETLALIDSYRDKWYSLRRGNLRANHWQEVADSVVARCLHLPAATPKTSVQCRHKIEKLRKRYRAERQRSLSHDPSSPPSSSWAYFRKMDAMENGGGGYAAPRSGPTPATTRSDDDEDDDDDDYARRRSGGGGGGGGSNTRSLHRLMANGGGGGGGSGIGGLRFTIPKAVRSKIVGSRVEERAAPGPRLNPNPSSRFFKGYGSGVRPAVEEMKWRMEKKRREGESDAAAEMVSALRILGDGFMRMEQMKMEMTREMEKVRMEMELKRTEMILDSQRRIIDAFVKGFFGDNKRAKISPDS